jgi:hypothetical protein
LSIYKKKCYIFKEQANKLEFINMASAELTEVMQRLNGFSQVPFVYCKFAIAFFLVWIIAMSPVLANKITPETQALFKSVRIGNMDGVEKSISDGADWTWRNIDGLTPVDVAINYSNFKIAHFILTLRKKTLPPPLPRAIGDTSSLSSPMQAFERKRSALLAKGDVLAKQKTTSEKPLRALEPEHIKDINIEQLVPKVSPQLTKMGKFASTRLEGVAKKADTKYINRDQLRVHDILVSFFENKTEGIKHSLKKKGATPPNSAADQTANFETKLLPLPVKITPAKSKPLSDVEKLLKVKELDPRMLDRLTIFFSNTIDKTKRSIILENSVDSEVSPKLAISSKNLPNLTKSDQIPSVERLMIENEPSLDVIDRLADFFTGTLKDTKASLVKDSPVGQEPTPNFPVFSEASAKPAKSDQAPIIEKLVIEKELNPVAIDRLAGFYLNTTEKTTRPLKTEVLVVPKPDPIVTAVPQSEILSKQVELEISEAKQSTTEILEPHSNKFKTPINTLQEDIATKNPMIVLDIERRVNPVLGKSLRLGKLLKAGSDNICINKGSRHLRFCVENVDWPKEIVEAFGVRTKLFHGAQAIVEYKKGIVKQVHALFLGRYFDSVVAYFNKRLGGVGKEFDNWAILPAEPNRRNPTFRWRGPGASILEIRQIDDLRWSSLPDTRHGVVRIYFEDPAPVFRHVSWSDFTLARILATRKKFCREAKITPCPW